MDFTHITSLYRQASKYNADIVDLNRMQYAINEYMYQVFNLIAFGKISARFVNFCVKLLHNKRETDKNHFEYGRIAFRDTH